MEATKNVNKTVITIERTASPSLKPDFNNLGFGRYFADHMFIMDYDLNQGWFDPRIVPYDNISLSPAAMVFHYGQAIFEGLKAYKAKDGEILLFRPDQNINRANISNARLCIPPIDPDFALEAICQLIKVDCDFVPEQPGTSLYIRPFIISTDPYLGVRPSNTYKFMIILSPVGAYYPEGLNPVKIYVENNYVRAVRGGLGDAKTPANYAASIKAQMLAQEKGYTQVLWLDGITREYIEEVGTMNVFFKIDGKVITPQLDGSILPGVTRSSVITLLKDWGIEVCERKISLEEIITAAQNQTLDEAFGTGTAAVISPIGQLNANGEIITINQGKTGEISAKLYDTITKIQTGEAPDPHGWRVVVK